MSRRFRDPSYTAPEPLTFRDWFLISTASGVVVGALAFIVIVALMIKPSWGHEAMSGWQYPWECCAGHDCAEISSSRVKPEGGGYVVDGRFHVTHTEVKHSPDGHYHACFPTPDMLRCFFAPPMGF